MKAGGFFHKDHEMKDLRVIEIEWSEQLGKAVWSNYLKTGLLESSDPALNHQLNTLKNVLQRHRQYYQLDREEEIIRRTLLEGPKFTEWCKKSLDFGFIKNHIPDKNEYPEYPKMFSFKDYFPEYVLPFWKTETEDIRYSFLPVEKPTEAIEKEFKAALYSILPDNVDLEINEARFIEHYATSSSLLPCGATTPHLVQAWKKAPQLPRDYTVKRCVIPIEPGNTRDAVILTPDQLFGVELLTAKLIRILSRVKSSLMGRSNSDLLHRVNYLLDKGKKHSCYRRDYKKEGISRPKHLTQWALETLEEKYPGKFSDFFFFLRYKIILDKDIDGLGKEGDILEPPRGSGLGMMNELVTLISCAITEMAFDRIEVECLPKVRRRIAVGIWNDDCTLVGKRKYTEILRQYDIAIHSDLGYILNFDKTIIMDNACWILGMQSSETYDCNKDYLFRTIIWSKEDITNIVFAKSFINSLTFPESVIDTVEDYISKFGYEFYPEEVNQPAAFGGWLRPMKMGLDTTLEYIDHSDISLCFKQMKAYNAIKERPSRMRLKRIEKKLNINEFRNYQPKFAFFSNEIVQNKFFDLTFYFNDPESLKKRLVLGMTMKERNAEWWTISHKLRRTGYKKPISSRNIGLDLTNLYLADHPSKLIYLPKRFVLEEVDPLFYCQYGYWFNKIEKRSDPIDLLYKFQMRIEPEDNRPCIIPEVTLSDLKQLDMEIEPR